MAQKVLVQLVDDLDGSSSDDIETVTFGLDGVNYEIDLGADNAERLRDGIAEFVGSARRVGGRVKRGAAPKPAPPAKPSAPGNREQTKAIREWARQQGHGLSDRGRIPRHIIEAFDEAHEPKKATTSSRSSSAGRKKGGRKKTAAPAFSG